MKSGQFLSVIVMYSIVGSSFYIHSMLLTQLSCDNLFKFDVIRVSFIFLPKERGGGDEIVWIIEGASMYLCAKHVAS